jgi:cytochrome P450
MGFLDAYNALSSGDQRKALLTEWVFRRRQELFAELRRNAPFLHTQDFVMVSRHEDVKAIFADSKHFNVKAYWGSFDFVLGKDKDEGHDADRAFLESLVPQAELERVHQVAAGAIAQICDKIMARYTGKAALPGGRKFRDPAGRINVPLGFARPVSVAVAQHYFGLTDPKPTDFGIQPLPRPPYPVPEPIEDPRPLLDPTFPCVANWITTLNGAFIHGAFGRYFTFDPVTIQQVVARVPQVRKEIETHISALIQGLQKQPSTGPATILQKMVAAEKFDSAMRSEERTRQLVEKVTRNLVGMVNGMVDNVTSAVSNAADFFLSHPGAQEMAAEVAQEVIPGGQPGADSAENRERRRQLWGMIREALRFNAPVPFLLRKANEDLVLAPGTVRETRIAEGTTLFLGVCSAMMDEAQWEQPLEFRPDRAWAEADDLIFGTGWHDCFGKYIAQAQIVEMMRALLTLQNFRRAPGRLGKLEYGTFFPKQLAVDFGPKPVQTALTAVMEIRAPQAFHAQALKLILSQAYQQVVDVLDRVGTVHFARFVFLENDSKLALMTSYDGAFDTYMKNYIEVAGDLFNLMLAHIKDAPPLPVRRYRDEFIAYVEKIDLVSDSPFYSAYGELTVQDILGMGEGAKK